MGGPPKCLFETAECPRNICFSESPWLLCGELAGRNNSGDGKPVMVVATVPVRADGPLRQRQSLNGELIGTRVLKMCSRDY